MSTEPALAAPLGKRNLQCFNTLSDLFQICPIRFLAYLRVYFRQGQLLKSASPRDCTIIDLYNLITTFQSR